MFREKHIVFVLCLAIFFKLSFYNFVILTSNDLFLIKEVTTHNLFKIGKKRKRELAPTSYFKNPAIIDEQGFAEETEIEENKGLIARDNLDLLRSFIYVLFTLDCLIGENFSILSMFKNVASYAPRSRKHLTLSVLRL